MPSPPPHTHVAIVGSGFAGLGMAARLRQEDRTDFVVFERADAVGGVWRDNVYPGAACDVQSHLYQFSFAPKADWTHRFAPQAEIRAYLEETVERFGLGPHLRFRHDVREARWDEAAARWRIETSAGPWTADVLVAAPGALAEPRLPDVPGLDRFEGDVFHSARWDEDADLTARRVAVVGTGASAIQIVPAIQPRVDRLVLFQRTPPWVMPRRDRPIGARTQRALGRVPLLRRAVRQGLYVGREGFGVFFRNLGAARVAERLARRHLRQQVADPALRRVLTPTYTIGCKRILLSDDYYPALTQPNVEVVDGGLVEVRTHGAVGPDGVERPVDAVVFCTGFHVTDLPFARHVVGREGRSLAEVWGDSMRAHLGTTVAGFPNLFFLQGPNTGLGHSSVLLMAEAQIEHVVNALAYVDAHRLAAVEPRPEAQAAFVAEVDRQMEGTVWTAGGCQSWYLDASGRNSTLWPGSIGQFRRRVEPFDPAEYRLRPASAVGHPALAHA